MTHRRVAGLVAVALAAGLLVSISRAEPASAVVTQPGTISTYAGTLGSGVATTIPQYPLGLAIQGSTLYISAYLANSGAPRVVRALDLNTGTETVYAGNGDPSSTGDGGPAVDAGISLAEQMAVDTAGNLYIATVDRIRRVDHSTGFISTVAGGGGGPLGDGGPATSATLLASGVAIAPSGDVIISDSGHNRVRRVHSGIITTIAGDGTAGFSGDGLPATQAELNSPEGVVVDGSSDIFVVDSQNARVREISAAGVISTVAGNGLNYPVCGQQGPGPGTATGFNLGYPIGLSIDGSGNLFITEGAGCVHELSAGMLTMVAGCSEPCSGQQGDGFAPLNTILYAPQGAVTDSSGNLYIAVGGGMRVQEAPAGGGTMFTVAGTGGWCASNTSGLAIDAFLCDPGSLAMDSSGNLFIAESVGHVVEKITPGGAISTVAGNGTYGNTGDGGSATAAELQGPGGIAVDASGNLYIGSGADLRKVSGGVITTLASGINPDGLAIDQSGNVIAASSTNMRVYLITPGGAVSTLAGTGTFGFSGDGGPATSAQLSEPSSVGVDSAGNVFIEDAGNQRIRRVDTGGTISTFAKLPVPPNGFSLSGQLTVGPDGQVVVGTTSNWQNVLMLTPSGNVAVAGTGVAGFSGDGGAATAAHLQQPEGLAFDASGDLFIADNGNHRIRRVQSYGATPAPANVTAQSGYASVRVRWTSPANTTGLPIIDYEVTPYIGVAPQPPVHVAGIPAATSVVIPGLVAGTQYTFKVSASNGWQRSADSTASPAVTALPHSGTGTIVTWAGTTGDGPPLGIAQAPYSVAINGTDIYVGDIANAVIRRVDTLTGRESVLAGNGSVGYSGDGGPATKAMISAAGAIAVCGGSTYFSDVSNYRIRKVDPNGVITTVAGTGAPGYSGDGGPATSARISFVLGLSCRTGGGLYISDSGNGAVRILDGSGNITTWWIGFSIPTGVAEMGANDTLAVADAGLANVVWALTDTNAAVLAGTYGQAGYADGAAVGSLLSDPRGVTYNGGSGVFVADFGNNRVRQILGGYVYTFAGNGTAGFSGDGGNSPTAELSSPTDVQLDGYTFVVADAGNFRVRKIQMFGCCPISTIAGNGTPSRSGDGGPSIDAQIGAPYAVAVDGSGNQYVADNADNVIRKIDTNGVITTVVGTGIAGYAGDGAAATNAELNDPRGVFVAGNGDLYITDTGNQVVRKVDHATGDISTVAGNQSLGAGFYGDGLSATAAQLNYPRAVAVNAAGDLFIADTGNNRVRKVSAGIISTAAGTGIAGFLDGPASAALLNGPRGLAFDTLGHLFIGDSGNNRVRELDLASGTIATFAGNGKAGAGGDGGQATAAELNFPFGLAFEPGGNLFVADTGNNRIRVIDPQGVITSVVGICGTSGGLSGDWGPASLAQVDFPYGLGVDGHGDIFIADSGNNRVRIIYGVAGVRTGTCPGPTASPGARSANAGPIGVPSSLRVEKGATSVRTQAATSGLPRITPRPLGMPSRSGHTAPVSGAAGTASSRNAAQPPATTLGAAPSSSDGAREGPSTAVAGQVSAASGARAPLGLAALTGLAVILVALAIGVRRRRHRGGG